MFWGGLFGIIFSLTFLTLFGFYWLHGPCVSFVMIAVSMIVLGIGNSYLIFLAGNFIWAIGDGFLINAKIALMYDSVKEIGQEQHYLKISGRTNIFSVLPLMLSGYLGPIYFCTMNDYHGY